MRRAVFNFISFSSISENSDTLYFLKSILFLLSSFYGSNQLLELFQEGARFFYFSKHRLFFFSPFCHAGRLLLLTDLSGFACSSNTRKRNRSKGGPLPVHLDPCCCFDFWYAANSKTRSVNRSSRPAWQKGEIS